MVIKKKIDDKKTRIKGLILGLILFIPLFFLNFFEAYEFLDFKLDFIDYDLVSPIAEIAYLFTDDFSMTVWRVAIPVYWILIWIFRTHIGCAINIFLKKI